MLSDNDLWRIVDYYRRNVKPREIKELTDVVREPNDKLVSYYITDSNLEVSALADLLKSPASFNEIFKSISQGNSTEELPRLEDGIEYGDHPIAIAGVVEYATRKFTQGYNKHLPIFSKFQELYFLLKSLSPIKIQNR